MWTLHTECGDLKYQLLNINLIYVPRFKNLIASDYHNMQKCIDSSINARWSDKMTFNTLHSKQEITKYLQFSGILHQNKEI